MLQFFPLLTFDDDFKGKKKFFFSLDLTDEKKEG